MKVVTSGRQYLDIDAYAGCIAYAELLNSMGDTAVAASTAAWNESITKTVRSWNAPLRTRYQPDSDDEFVLIDTSEPQSFDTFVQLDRVTGVIDHHPGLEQYWHDKLGEAAVIEFVGAACTLVYEKWVAAGLLDRMSPTSARLLIAGILDNTLNFGAHITHERDKKAYADLLIRADLPADWTAQYFGECQEGILADIATAVRNDSKTLEFASLDSPIAVGQLVIWDARPVIRDNLQTIRKTMHAMRPEWFANIVSIHEGKSYFLCDDQAVQLWAQRLLGVRFEDGIARANRLWLRKEIIKQSIETAKLES